MELTYELKKTNRKTISLTIERNNDIIIKAPLHATDEKVEDFFVRKQLWIYTKLEEKKQFMDCPDKKEFVDGEGFYYLWRMYKLQLVDNVDYKITFQKNTFFLNRQYTNIWKELFIEWYKQRFEKRVTSRIKLLSNIHGLHPTKVSVKELKNRWGSCTSDNKLNFHWKVMLAPLWVIEYIIIHELCHIKVKSHSPKYWDLLAKHMPDYEWYKDWLKRNGWEFIL